jgi:hypothetical protein
MPVLRLQEEVRAALAGSRPAPAVLAAVLPADVRQVMELVASHGVGESATGRSRSFTMCPPETSLMYSK